MADISHDVADDGFHEIQLNGKQLVFLFIIATLVLVAIFLTGVKVGRQAREVSGDAAVVTAADPDPSPAAAPLSEAGPPAAEPPAPPVEVPDELSYHKRLQAEGAQPEELKTPQPAAVAPTVAPARAASVIPADVPVSGKAGVWAVQVYASRDRAVAEGIVKRLTAKGYPAFLVMPAPDVAEQFYKVHVGRYPDRREAEQVSLRLKKDEQFQPWITR